MNSYILFLFLIVTMSCGHADTNKEYFSNGKLKSIGTYYDGDFSGIQYVYHESGDLKEIVKYRSGIKINSAIPDNNRGLKNETEYLFEVEENSPDCSFSFILGVSNSFSDTILYKISHFDFEKFESTKTIKSGVLIGQNNTTHNLKITPDYDVISIQLIDYITVEKNERIGFMSIPVMRVIQFEIKSDSTNCIRYTYKFL